MTKSQVARHVAGILKCSIEDAERTVQAVFDVLANGLVKDNGVRIPSFGTFSLFHRKARKIREINTGALLTLRPQPQVSFRASARLKEKIRTC